MTGGPTEREEALAREVERLARRLDEAEQHRADIEASIREVVELLSGPGGPRPLSWLDPAPPDHGPGGGPNGSGRGGPPRISPAEAAARLDDLASWLARVYLRFEGAELPSCWAWHPDVVEELLWLRGAHAEAYSGRTASWLRVGDWHDRQRPGVVKRIRLAIGTCALTEHRATRRHGDRAQPVVPLAEHLPVVAGAWAHRLEVPEPTASALAAADGHVERQP